MGLFNKRPPEEHVWLSDGDLRTSNFALVHLTRRLDASYLALLDSDVAELHRWPSELFRFAKRTLGANDRIRSSYTRHVGVLVPIDDPTYVVGFISVEKAHPDIPGPYFIDVHLQAEYRRTGIMSELLPDVIAHLRERDLGEVIIATSNDNAAMAGLCKRLRLNYKKADHEYRNGVVEQARLHRIIKETS